MAEINHESQEFEVAPKVGAAPKEDDRQSLLLQLAERTVLQAEALAKEITDRARQESEAEGARLLAEYVEQAKAEALRETEAARRRSETILSESTAQALSESERTLSEARSESEKTLSDARSESDRLLGLARSESDESLGKAHTEGREFLGKAQIEVKEVLGKAQQEALTIVNSAQARADSTESNARLKAEFIIRQTTQNVADEIKSAVLETCNSLLPALGNLLEGVTDLLEKERSATPLAEQVDHATAALTDMLDNAASSEPKNSSSPADTESNAHSSDTPSGRRTRSSARTPGKS